MNEAIRLAKIENEARLRADLMRLLNHPVYSLLAVFIIIEALQQIQLPSGDYFMSRTGTVLEGALLSKEALTAVNNSVPALTSLAPLLALIK